MELAKITANGQITLPLAIRRKLNLKDGGKVAFVENEGGYRIINPTKMAIIEAQNAFAGLSEELGLKSEEDVIALCKDVRNDMWVKNNANNG